MKILILIYFVALSGCATSDIVGTSNKGDKSTVIVKYLNQGADMIISSRRSDAILQAKRHCRGKVKLLSEGSKSEIAGYSTYSIAPGTVYSMNSEYNLMEFECLEKKKEEIY